VWPGSAMTGRALEATRFLPKRSLEARQSAHIYPRKFGSNWARAVQGASGVRDIRAVCRTLQTRVQHTRLISTSIHASVYYISVR